MVSTILKFSRPDLIRAIASPAFSSGRIAMRGRTPASTLKSGVQVPWLRENVEPLLVEVDLQSLAPNRSSSSSGCGGGGFIAASISSNTFLMVAGSSSAD